MSGLPLSGHQTCVENSFDISDIMKKILYLLAILMPVSGCRGTVSDIPLMPDAPDYSEDQMWYRTEAVCDTGADVFYILPTCVWDWTDSLGRTCHFADVYNSDHIGAMLPSNTLAREIFGRYADFYSPYYRQITLDSWVSEDIADARFPYAMDDVFGAFRYYMENWNNGRPFFLAGFSQGAKCVLELLKSLDDDELDRMVAAYIIGYKVTPDDMESRCVRPAGHADDTGVTICYNSVESPASIYPGLAGSEICINPLNWSCGPEPAEVDDSVSVFVDTEYNVLLVKGLDSDKYYHPSLGELFPKGNYHLLELTLYDDALRENVRTRSEAFLAGRQL